MAETVCFLFYKKKCSPFPARNDSPIVHTDIAFIDLADYSWPLPTSLMNYGSSSKYRCIMWRMMAAIARKIAKPTTRNVSKYWVDTNKKRELYYTNYSKSCDIVVKKNTQNKLLCIKMVIKCRDKYMNEEYCEEETLHNCFLNTVKY